MDNLRLILILLGVLLLALIVLLHRPEGESRRNHARWRAARRKPAPDVLPNDGDETRSEPVLESAGSNFEIAPKWPEAGQHDTQPAPDRQRPARAEDSLKVPEKIVHLYVCSRDDRLISGSELLDAAIKAGLSFGEMNIFHRRHEGEREPVFSMANLVAPGNFDSSQWNVFETPGVTLFLTLPAPVSALDAWDAMLATAERISKLLDADILDDGKCLLIRQRIAQIREEMREYDRQSGMIKPE